MTDMENFHFTETSEEHAIWYDHLLKKNKELEMQRMIVITSFYDVMEKEMEMFRLVRTALGHFEQK